MKKRMGYISSMVVKTRVASITEGKHIIHGKLKKNIKFYVKVKFSNYDFCNNFNDCKLFKQIRNDVQTKGKEEVFAICYNYFKNCILILT